jgi:hypothetical protein
MIRNKKQEIEALSLELMELLVRRLSEEKKRQFEALESIERAYQEKAQHFKKCEKSREELLSYLVPLIKDKEIFWLKMHASSGWGISKLKECLLELRRLSGATSKKEKVALEQAAAGEIGLNVDMKVYRSLREGFKETVRSQPLLFLPHTPPRRYSFRGRQSKETLATRPSSSTEIKTRSLEGLRPIQTRSQFMI